MCAYHFDRELPRMTWPERGRLALLLVILLPLLAASVVVRGLGWMVVGLVHTLRRVRFGKGDLFADWYAARAVWEKARVVSGPEITPSLDMPRSDRLVLDFVRRHPNAVLLVRRALTDPNPYVAAYAFKCLVRLWPSVRLEEIPPEVLNRAEPIDTLMGSCCVERMTLGDWIRGYFAGRRLASG